MGLDHRRSIETSFLDFPECSPLKLYHCWRELQFLCPRDKAHVELTDLRINHLTVGSITSSGILEWRVHPDLNKLWTTFPTLVIEVSGNFAP